VELHGALSSVTCLGCGAREPRASVHARLLERNPGWVERAGSIRPDGDVEIDLIRNPERVPNLPR
jgi:NAD-dependent SIR2 family protein deacetylase